MTVIDLVNRERGRLSRLIAAAGGAAAVGLGALLLAAGVVALGRARWIDLPRVVPFAVWLAVAIVAAVAIWWTRKRLARDASVSGLAYEVEREQSLRAGALRGALEVAGSGTLGRHNAEQVARRLTQQAGGKSLTPTLTRRALIRTGSAVVAGAVGILLLATRSSATPDGWRAIAHPVRAWTGTLLAPISLQSAPRTVLRGERVALSISAPDRRRITVYQRAKGSAWRSSQHEVRDGVARVRLAPMDADLAIFATDGRTMSDTASLEMVERPFIGDVAVRATFPAYLDRREETLPVGEAARLPRGTTLAISGHSSTELTAVALARATDTLHLTTSGRSFTGRMAGLQTGRYEWSAAGVGGRITEVPAALEIEVVPDSAPRIEILSPATDTTVSAADTIPLSFLATDDHGLATVLLRVWRQPEGGTAMPDTTRPLLSQPMTQWTGDATLSLPALGVQAGEAVHIVAIAVDGSPWRQNGSSRELVLRVPGMTEARANVRAAADSAVQRAQAAAAAQKALQQRTTEAARARQRNTTPRSAEKNAANTKGSQNSMSYEAAQQAQQLAKEQRDLAERMQQLRQSAEQLEKQLKQTGALDSALSQRLQEAQKLLRDALTPELAEKLRKLEESAQKLSAEDAQKALGDLSQQQQRLREQLEKSVEMLKRAALEGSMQTLKEEAKDIAKDERELADSMAKSRSTEQKQEAQRDARDLADRSRDLAKQVEELQKRLEREKADPGARRVNDANQQVKESADAMQRAAQNQQDQRRGDGEQQSGQRQQQTAQQQQQGQQSAQPQRGQQQAQKGQEQNAPGQQKSQEQKGQGQQKGQEQAQPGAQKQESQPGQQGQPSQQGQQQGQQPGQQQGQQQGQQGQQGGQQAAKDAADAMQRAADQLADARKQQIDAWKQELTTELDQSIQEMLQLSRQQESLEQKARQGADKASLQAEQSALQQGVQQAGKRLGEAGQKSSLFSPRAQRSVGDAQKKVEQATRDLANARQSEQAAGSMREASEALNQAAASLVRDRERAQNANSASGFSEMLEQLKDMAQQQGSLNAQTAELIPRPGAQLDQQGREQARQLGRQQREVASSLDEMSDQDRTGRAEELAKEARQLAQALESGGIDPNVIDRQQRLFRRMLDAGRTLERDEREDNGKREAKAATGNELFLPPNAPANGKAASRFAPPNWNDLRGLTPEERRLVLDYFKRINAEKP
jgi:hypothetical protein